MSSVTDYQDRTYDIAAFQGLEASGMHFTPQQLRNEQFNGMICTGTAKLAQRFIIEFLTPIGSMAFRPTRGCSFMSRLMAGSLSTEHDVLSAFALSVSQIGTNFAADVLPTDQPDEIFANASLVRIGLSQTTISLTIELTSKAGTTRQVILPIPILPEAVA